VRILQIAALRKTFGPKRNEETREWREIHNQELRNMCSPPNIIRASISRRIIWAGHAERMKDRRGADRALVERPDGKRPLGRPRHSWEYNNKMDLQDIG
jgi:hypothetical protein